MKGFVFGAAALLLLSCSSNREKNPPATLFSLVPPDRSGVAFRNDLTYTEEFNMYTYRNFYNGGGVGVGDVNNDGRPDLFFCGNMVDNKLYLNLGNWRFRDVTDSAGVASHNVWSTGVALADVNGDGWLDIYVCKSGSPEGERRHNELFLNNGDGGPDKTPTFTEAAHQWGIADKGLSTHAAFFDYDRDGDLDCYLLNNSFRSVGGYDLRRNQRLIRDSLGGNKLYRNDGDHFTDVSEQAGIYGSAIGFGLGVTISDLDRDGWPDIYVSNDFFERDYLYLNNHDGTFREALEEHLREISLGSMGADAADLNNDGWPEIFVTEMLPPDDARLKTKAAFESWDKYQENLRNGYFRQFARNVLQLNNGDGTFSEIGRLAGVHATDWSWGALIFDADLDGRQDLFVANGIYKDLLDQDYINFYSVDPAILAAIKNRERGAILRLLEGIPSEKLPNYLFRNLGDYRFENVAPDWGLAIPSHSNGSAYGDLDNDGDLDLVVNNVNMPSFLFRNNAETLLPERRWLRLRLEGEGRNRFAVGAQVTLVADRLRLFRELFPMRGFQSCVDGRLFFGLGGQAVIDTLQVVWPDGRLTLLTGVETNQELTLRQVEAAAAHSSQPPPPTERLFRLTDTRGIDYRHQENPFDDFDRDPLLFHMRSNEGPPIALGDFDGDGLEDVFLGGAKDSPGALFRQQPGGRYQRRPSPALEADAPSEDTDALFFDADNDGDLDLYVCSGGNEYPPSASALNDRLYLNDGRGGFQKANAVLPAGRFESSSCVAAADYDADGDLDLFVGIRLRPFLFGVPANGYLLENDGRGNFRNRTSERAPQLLECGLITDAQWLDYDLDGDPDLAVCGEWMPLRLFENRNGRLEEVTAPAGLQNTNGWWLSMAVADFDADGDPDLALGNLGLNTRFQASPTQPLTLYVHDFDRNGDVEQIITAFNGERAYPLVLRNDLVGQLPRLKKKYLKFSSYRNQTIEDIFSPSDLEGALQHHIVETRSALALNNGDGTFRLLPLPTEAQFAPVYALLPGDFDGDGHLDLLLGGNLHRAKPETGIYAASWGTFLHGNGDGTFRAVPNRVCGLRLDGEVRDFARLGKHLILVARNDAEVLLLENLPKSPVQ